MKNLALIFLITIFSGCTYDFWYRDFVTPKEKLQPPKFQLLSLGMSKSEVNNVLGKPDQIIGGKKVEGKFLEKWEYHRYKAVEGPDQLAERYYVEFTEGMLSAYGASGDFKQEINIKK